MRKLVTLVLALTSGLATAANAALPALAMSHAEASIVTVGEGCGANHWRDRYGNCHWFGGPGGSNRGTPIECPPGTHIGPRHGACWPN